MPGVGLLKLHKLLYYCQGHQLAHSGGSLFPERVSACDHGPVVGKLWFDEEHGSPSASEAPGPPLDEEALNTIGYVLSRYGRMTGHDLEVLTHNERPWRLAEAGRGHERSSRIGAEVMADYFRHEGAETAGSGESVTASDHVREFLAAAVRRGPGPGLPDTREALLRSARAG